MAGMEDITIGKYLETPPEEKNKLRGVEETDLIKKLPKQQVSNQFIALKCYAWCTFILFLIYEPYQFKHWVFQAPLMHLCSSHLINFCSTLLPVVTILWIILSLFKFLNEVFTSWFSSSGFSSIYVTQFISPGSWELSSGSGTKCIPLVGAKDHTGGTLRPPDHNGGGHYHLRRRQAVPGAHQGRTSEKESPPPRLFWACSAQRGPWVACVPPALVSPAPVWHRTQRRHSFIFDWLID